MELDEYIEHLQNLRKTYAGLDIEVVQPKPRRHISDGYFVAAANEPQVLPVETDGGALWVRGNVQPLPASSIPKAQGPDGVVVV